MDPLTPQLPALCLLHPTLWSSLPMPPNPHRMCRCSHLDKESPVRFLSRWERLPAACLLSPGPPPPSRLWSWPCPALPCPGRETGPACSASSLDP